MSEHNEGRIPSPNRPPTVQDARRGQFTKHIPERRTPPRTKPQIFLLKWRDLKGTPKGEQEERKGARTAHSWQECWGTLYPNGRVALDFGSPYPSMSDLREYLAQVGPFLLTWLEPDPHTPDEEEETAIPPTPPTSVTHQHALSIKSPE